MSGEDLDDEGSGFAYLEEQIEPTRNQKWTIGIIAFLVSGGFWVYATLSGERESYRSRYPY